MLDYGKKCGNSSAGRARYFGCMTYDRTILKFILIALLLTQSVLAADAFRTIAILENERMFQAEPNVSLSDFFRNSSPAVRARAALAAARIGNEIILPQLETISNDSSVEVRKMVAFAFGQIRSKNGLPAALKMLKDPDVEVRRLAIEAVGRIGGLDTTSNILAFLSDQNAQLREQAALALALIKDKATVETLIIQTGKNDPVQWSYVYALYRLADERALPALHKVLANPVASPSTGDPSSLLFALKALWSMKKNLTLLEIETLLRHSDPRVTQNALDVIAASGDKASCAALHQAYSTMNDITRGKVLDTMGSLGCMQEDRPAKPVLLGAWISAQAKAQKDNALASLQEGASHPSWIVRWRTAQALSGLSAEKAIPILKNVMNDQDSAVRLAALDSLAAFMPQTIDVFVPLLNDRDFAVQATAVDAVGKTRDPKYLPALIGTYHISKDASEIEGRVALLDVLPDFNSSEALKVYEEALQDPEFTIRRHAIDGLKKMLGSSPWFFRQKLADPESFAYRSGKLKLKETWEYPQDYGHTREPVKITLKLEKGDVTIRLFHEEAPLHVENIVKLAQRGFYNGLRIHRVVPNFVIQGGDPRGDGWGGAGEVIHDQVNLRVYKRGIVGMPTAGKDTGGSQFFITQSRQPHLDGNYTVFGEVIAGMDVVDRTEAGDKILSVNVN